MAGLSLGQLQKMGAQPAANVDPSKGMTLNQLVASQKGAGATTASTPKPVVAPPATDLGDRVAANIQEHGAEAERIINDPTEGNDLTRGVKAAAQGAEAVAAPVIETGKTLWDHMPDFIKNEFFNLESMKSVTDARNAQPASKFDIALANLAQKNPEAYNKVKNTLQAVSAGGEIAGTVAGAGEAATGAGEVPSIKTTANDVKSTVADIKTKIAPTQANATQAEMDAIGAKIAPKPTAAEAKIAQDEGRLVKGQQPTMFRSGTPDTVIPTKEEARAVGTIYREIPGASKMDEATLTNELNNTVSTKAQTLKPQMEATPIKPETVQKINDDWANIKAKQLSEADKTEEANVVKRQDAFQKNYLEKTKAENLNDLWETAKKYDASVPDKVKQASDLSDISLQNKKTEWLQNRSVLRSAITDSGSGLSEESSQAFADMHDMYNAKENLLSKAKIETKVAPSKIKQFSDSKTGKIVKNVVKASVGVAGLKEVIGH